MSFLEAPLDSSSMRKSRKNSMRILRASSVISCSDDGPNIEIPHEDLLADPHDLFQDSKSQQESLHDHQHHHAAPTDKEALVMSVSALYGKLLVVIGMGFPIANTLSPDLPLIYYNSFYLYLYFGSIFFVIYAYVSLLSSFTMQLNNLILYCKDLREYIRPFSVSVHNYFSEIGKRVDKPMSKMFTNEDTIDRYKSEYTTSSESVQMSQVEEGSESRTKKSKFVYTENAGHGSMYLKMGTIIFGIGSMIYSGLEFGHYFELRADCSNILMAITPASRMVFTFLQMYFIFLNSRVSISRHTTIARFGLIHMVATNLCIWLNVLVEETKHTIHHVTHLQHEGHNIHESQSHHFSKDHGDDYEYHDSSRENSEHNIILASYVGDTSLEDYSDYDEDSKEVPFTLYNKSLVQAIVSNLTTVASTLSSAHTDTYSAKEGLGDGQSNFHNLVKRGADEHAGCRIVNLMGDMVNSAAPLLFPCTIEYSLLCASVLYVMWKNVQVKKAKSLHNGCEEHQLSQMIARKVRHLYSVDCGRASRGLFTGIFVLVLTLISLILFYVLVSNPDFKYYGILSANISEILIYSVGIVTTVIGMMQLRKLGFIEEDEIELDNVLLVVAQAGVYMFTIFTLIGGYFSKVHTSALTQITALVILVQATMQTLYILDGSRRCCRTNEQLEKKHGREIVTFLLTLNLSMWLLSTFQTSRAYLHEPQQQFYGIWAWTIINHVSMPLAIFYRFHATVCLGEIWKRAYKIRAEE